MISTEERQLLQSLGLLDIDRQLNSPVLERDWKRLSDLSLKNLHENGDFSRRLAAIRSIVEHDAIDTDFSLPAPRVFAAQDAKLAQCPQAQLAGLGHWKKGPFSIFGTQIEGEWQCQLKWERVQELASPLQGRRVLDVGTGNGYYLYRAHGEGAQFVLGLEPSGLYVAQFLALQRCFRCPQIGLLPLNSDEFTQDCAAFDTVFSMGVLYHRRSPLDHLAQLRSFLRPGGELIIETIVVDGELGYSLLPPDRYAQMRNTWFLPSVATLHSWLRRMAFTKIQIGPTITTSTEEQHSTAWTGDYSLKDFLDPKDPHKTVEGHPAPKRVMMTAIAP